MKNISVHSFFINDYCELVFQKVDIGQNIYGDVRQFVHSEKYTGPTQKGLLVDKFTLEKIIDALVNNKNKILNATAEENIETLKYKNNSLIIISLRESTLDNNPVCVDIREYLKSAKYEGFTKRGFRFSKDQIDEFVEGCIRLINILEDNKEII